MVLGEGVKASKFDVNGLKKECGDKEESVKKRYLQEVLQRAEDSWCESAGHVVSSEDSSD